jgi:outer membrane protein
MHKYLAYGVLALMLLLATNRAEAAPPSKVGFVDLQRTLNETKVGKAARAGLESEKKKKQKELDDKQAALKKQLEDLKKQQAIMTPENLAKKEKELQDKYVALQQTFMQFQQELAKNEQKLTREIFDKASSIIGDIAKREGYTMIVEKNEGAVLYADPSVDITAEVNKRVDAGEGKAPAKPAKK